MQVECGRLPRLWIGLGVLVGEEGDRARVGKREGGGLGDKTGSQRLRMDVCEARQEENSREELPLSLLSSSFAVGRRISL